VEQPPSKVTLNSHGAVRAGIRMIPLRPARDAGDSVGHVSKSEGRSVRSGLTVPFELSAA
jgi:hypothetical protein